MQGRGLQGREEQRGGERRRKEELLTVLFQPKDHPDWTAKWFKGSFSHLFLYIVSPTTDLPLLCHECDGEGRWTQGRVVYKRTEEINSQGVWHPVWTRAKTKEMEASGQMCGNSASPRRCHKQNLHLVHWSPAAWASAPTGWGVLACSASKAHSWRGCMPVRFGGSNSSKLSFTPGAPKTP